MFEVSGVELYDELDGRRIIAIDFDGTLCKNKWPYIGEPNAPLINRLKEVQRYGDILILWTCREGKLLREAVEWCHRQGLVFTRINRNFRKLKGQAHRKIWAHVYIDDKAVKEAYGKQIEF